MKTKLLLFGIFILILSLAFFLYLFKTSNYGFIFQKTINPTETTLKGGSIYARFYCIGKVDRIPCKGGLVIKDESGYELNRKVSDSNGILRLALEVDAYLLEAWALDSKYKISQVQPTAITIEQGKTKNVEVTYWTGNRNSMNFLEDIQSCITVANHTYQFYTTHNSGMSEQTVKSQLEGVGAFNISFSNNSYYYNLPNGQICAGIKKLRSMGVNSDAVPMMPTAP